MIKHIVLRGEPIRLGEREIVPEARLTWQIQRRATFGTDASLGYGWGWARVQPTALIEQGPKRTRRTLIHDQTKQLLWGLLAGALAVPLLMQVAVRLARSHKTK